MAFIRLNDDGSIHGIIPGGHVEWDAAHYCPAVALTVEEAKQFQVFAYQEALAPPHDKLTQGVREVLTGPALIIDGFVVQQWEVYPLPEEVVADNIARAEAALLADIKSAVQLHLDTRAKERGYDSLLSACTYDTSTNPKFAAEGTACKVWRDAVWAHCWSVLDDVESGKRPAPTAEALLAELPILEWP